jgi:hypothetical protein
MLKFYQLLKIQRDMWMVYAKTIAGIILIPAIGIYLKPNREVPFWANC